MSHFSVAVIHRADQSVDDLLAPFDEELEVDSYVRYTKEEAIQWVRDNIPSYANRRDETCYKLMASDHEVDEDGNILSTYNPNSQWDWYVIGGRWSEMLKVGDTYCDEAYISEIEFDPDFETYAVVTPDGEWHETAHMGWFGMDDGTQEQYDTWKSNYKSQFIDAYPDLIMTIVDCHI